MRRINGRRLRLVAAKLWNLGPGGWRLLVQAHRALVAADALVRERPQGELIAGIARGYTPSASAVSRLPAAEEVALALDRVARFRRPRPLCLVRSIALHRLLERRGLSGSRISVGVRMNGRTFEAHAWVELDGRIVGDDPAYVTQFDALSDLTESSAARMVMTS